MNNDSNQQTEQNGDPRPLDEVIKELTERQASLESELAVANAKILERDRAIKVLLNGNSGGRETDPAADFKKKLHI